MSAPSVPIRKSPMREQFDRIAEKFAAEALPLTRADVAHLIALARAQVEANEPLPCNHAQKFAVMELPGGTVCLMCEFSRSRHGHAQEDRA